MTYVNQLEKYIRESDGILFAKEVVESGIPSSYLSEFEKEGKLVRVEYGVYTTPTTLEDSLYIMQKRRERIIFSHETALYLHDLSDRDPLSYFVTVPAGYNTSRLKADGIIVFTIKEELYEMGVTMMETSFGRPIRAYDMERTICDMVRSRNRVDRSLLTDAMQRYAQRKDRNISLLLHYANQLNVQTMVRQYLEVLL